MKIAVMTMVYNESFNLPSWVSHYSAQCPGCELFVVDHGSDVGVREAFPDVNVLRLPRSDFDERRRADLVSKLHGALLLEFDWVFYTDCDELIVSADRSTLAESLAEEPADVMGVNAVGLNLWHHVDVEPPFERGRSIGEQRGHASFEKSMCKPFATRVPTAWIPGFHTSNVRSNFGRGYYLVHTKYMDHEESARRLALTSGLEWSAEALERGWSSHQRIDAEKLRSKFAGIAGFIDRGEVDDFDFAEYKARFIAECVEDSRGNWRCDAKFDGKIVRIPDELLAKLP